MAWVIALKDHYYAGPRKAGDRYDARPDLVESLEKMGNARREETTTEAPEPGPGSPPVKKPKSKPYGRRDMKPE